MAGGEAKPKVVYMAGYALILHIVVVENIPAFERDMTGTISLRMLKWGANLR